MVVTFLVSMLMVLFFELFCKLLRFNHCAIECAQAGIPSPPLPRVFAANGRLRIAWGTLQSGGQNACLASHGFIYSFVFAVLGLRLNALRQSS